MNKSIIMFLIGMTVAIVAIVLLSHTNAVLKTDLTSLNKTYTDYKASCDNTIANLIEDNKHKRCAYGIIITPKITINHTK